MRRSIEPCLCGDPECPRCFPQSRDDHYDETLADEERHERAEWRRQHHGDADD